jgi:hypothetical protein
MIGRYKATAFLRIKVQGINGIKEGNKRSSRTARAATGDY